MIKSAIISVTVVIISLAVLELAGRLLAGNKFMKLEPHGDDPALIGYFAPGQAKTILFPGVKPYAVRTNALGLRDTGVSLDPKDLMAGQRILTIGDSVTFGLFVNDEDSYPYRLQTLFTAAGGGVKVLNAGIGSTSIQDHYGYLMRRGLAANPSVVIVNFCTNDIEELKRNKIFYDMFHEQKGESLLQRSGIMRAFLNAYVNGKYRRWMKKIKDLRARQILSHNRASLDDVLYVAEHHIAPPVLLTPYDPKLDAAWREYFSYLDRMIEVLWQRRIPLIVFAHPEVLSVYKRVPQSYEQRLADHLKGKPGVYFVDPVPLVQARGGDVLSVYSAPPRDFHLSRAGNDLLAAELYRVIIQNRLLGTPVAKK